VMVSQQLAAAAAADDDDDDYCHMLLVNTAHWLMCLLPL